MSVRLTIGLAGFGRAKSFASLVEAFHDRNVGGLACPSVTVLLPLSRRGSGMTTTQLRSPIAARLLLAGLVLMIALFSAVGVAVPTAHADAVDGNFINALGSRGITFANPQAAIIAAHEVCDELDSGRASTDVANDGMQQSSLDGYRAGFFVGVSIAAFCPRHQGA